MLVERRLGQSRAGAGGLEFYGEDILVSGGCRAPLVITRAGNSAANRFQAIETSQQLMNITKLNKRSLGIPAKDAVTSLVAAAAVRDRRTCNRLCLSMGKVNHSWPRRLSRAHTWQSLQAGSWVSLKLSQRTFETSDTVALPFSPQTPTSLTGWK